MSNRKIAKLFGVDDKTVGKTIKDTADGCGILGIPHFSAPSVLPLAIEKPPLRYAFNTEDRSGTLSGIFEIPEGQYEVLTCESMEEVILLSMRANAAHGNQNSVEDRVMMMTKLIQMDEKRFMNGPWEVSQKEVAAALQITKMQAQAACQPKNDELKGRRDAAILELHKGGKSNGEIDKSLGLGKDYTRRFLNKQAPPNNAS